MVAGAVLPLTFAQGEKQSLPLRHAGAAGIRDASSRQEPGDLGTGRRVPQELADPFESRILERSELSHGAECTKTVTVSDPDTRRTVAQGVARHQRWGGAPRRPDA